MILYTIKPKWLTAILALTAVLALAAVSGAAKASRSGQVSDSTSTPHTNQETQPANPAGENTRWPMQIRTARGVDFSGGEVVRVDEESLLIRHRDGMAKDSVFDLDERPIFPGYVHPVSRELIARTASLRGDRETIPVHCAAAPSQAP